MLASALSSAADRDLATTVTAGKQTFRLGEPIHIELRVRSEGKKPLALTFPTAQRFDFQIVGETGEIFWRWSEGKLFAQALGKMTLSPENPEVHYEAVFQGSLPPGRYHVRGFLTTLPQPLSSSTRITIH